MVKFWKFSNGDLVEVVEINPTVYTDSVNNGGGINSRWGRLLKCLALLTATTASCGGFAASSSSFSSIPSSSFSSIPFSSMASSSQTELKQIQQAINCFKELVEGRNNNNASCWQSTANFTMAEDNISRAKSDDSTSISINTVTGKKISLNVDLSDTVYKVKTKIYDLEGKPPCQQWLVYGGKQLEDDRALYEYDIQEESIINLVYRPRGGGDDDDDEGDLLLLHQAADPPLIHRDLNHRDNEDDGESKSDSGTSPDGGNTIARKRKRSDDDDEDDHDDEEGDDGDGEDEPQFAGLSFMKKNNGTFNRQFKILKEFLDSKNNAEGTTNQCYNPVGEHHDRKARNVVVCFNKDATLDLLTDEQSARLAEINFEHEAMDKGEALAHHARTSTSGSRRSRKKSKILNGCLPFDSEDENWNKIIRASKVAELAYEHGATHSGAVMKGTPWQEGGAVFHVTKETIGGMTKVPPKECGLPEGTVMPDDREVIFPGSLLSIPGTDYQRLPYDGKKKGERDEDLVENLPTFRIKEKRGCEEYVCGQLTIGGAVSFQYNKSRRVRNKKDEYLLFYWTKGNPYRKYFIQCTKRNKEGGRNKRIGSGEVGKSSRYVMAKKKATVPNGCYRLNYDQEGNLVKKEKLYHHDVVELLGSPAAPGLATTTPAQAPAQAPSPAAAAPASPHHHQSPSSSSYPPPPPHHSYPCHYYPPTYHHQSPSSSSYPPPPPHHSYPCHYYPPTYHYPYYCPTQTVAAPVPLTTDETIAPATTAPAYNQGPYSEIINAPVTIAPAYNQGPYSEIINAPVPDTTDETGVL